MASETEQKARGLYQTPLKPKHTQDPETGGTSLYQKPTLPLAEPVKQKIHLKAVSSTCMRNVQHEIALTLDSNLVINKCHLFTILQHSVSEQSFHLSLEVYTSQNILKPLLLLSDWEGMDLQERYNLASLFLQYRAEMRFEFICGTPHALIFT